MLRPWKLQLELDAENKHIPMYQQLADKVQQLIVSGTLKVGDVLPGSREIATQLHLSRKTVVSAMELLTFSGWLENRERVGLFVRDRQVLTKTDNTGAQTKVESPVGNATGLVINDGFPDTKLVPYEELSRAFRQSFNRAARWKQMGYSDPRGDQKMREMLSQQMRQEYSLNVVAEGIQITRGSQQALFLAAHALFHPGDAVVMELPTYQNAKLAFESANLEVIQIPVDEEGLQVDLLAQALNEHPNIRGLYITPRFQYPTTVTLSAARRRQLAELVTLHQTLVLEDDFGCQFHFSAQRLLPLGVQLPLAHYIYIGTFSKVLAPALRMGFIASSPDIVARVAAYRRLIDIQGDATMERAIRELMENGDIRRHVRKAMRVYRERLDYISRRIMQDLRGKVTYRKPRGGLALWLVFAQDPTAALQTKGIQAQIFAMPDGTFGLRVGYASMQQEEIDQLIDCLM